MKTEVVSAAALVARINRELNPESTITKTCTPGAGFVLTNLCTGNVKPMTLRDLVDMARELDVLADFEILTAPPVPPDALPTITPMFGNYRYSLTDTQQSAIQLWLRLRVSEEDQQSPEWKLLHNLTYAESWTPHKAAYPLVKLVGDDTFEERQKAIEQAFAELSTRKTKRKP
jgi:hypothetical protein